jgi:PAS domain S-box-containing protein
VPVHNQGDSITHWVGTLTDITERLEAEQALRASEERFRRALEIETVGILFFTPDGKITGANDAFLRMGGYSREDVATGRLRWDELTPPEWMPHALRAVEEFKATGRTTPYEKQYMRTDRSRWWGLSAATLLNEYEGVEFVLDISGRKQATEEALRQTQAELAHASRLTTMGELAASIAHEINQPLTAVVTNGNACLRWLARETPDLAEARAAVERIIREAHRASEVIRQVRALVRKTDPQKVWLDLNGLIPEVVALVQSEARRHGVALRTALTATLPPVLGNGVQVQQVLLNLLLNGIEAMQPVTDRPRELLLRSQRHGADAVLVAVQDSGIGLDPERTARLFDAFVTTKPGGLGLGLAISRSIIEAHGGRLWASPNAGPGATFQFTLPTGGEWV